MCKSNPHQALITSIGVDDFNLCKKLEINSDWILQFRNNLPGNYNSDWIWGILCNSQRHVSSCFNWIWGSLCISQCLSTLIKQYKTDQTFIVTKKYMPSNLPLLGSVSPTLFRCTWQGRYHVIYHCFTIFFLFKI